MLAPMIGTASRNSERGIEPSRSRGSKPRRAGGLGIVVTRSKRVLDGPWCRVRQPTDCHPRRAARATHALRGKGTQVTGQVRLRGFLLLSLSQLDHLGPLVTFALPDRLE